MVTIICDEDVAGRVRYDSEWVIQHCLGGEPSVPRITGGAGSSDCGDVAVGHDRARDRVDFAVGPDPANPMISIVGYINVARCVGSNSKGLRKRSACRLPVVSAETCDAVAGERADLA